MEILQSKNLINLFKIIKIYYLDNSKNEIT